MRFNILKVNINHFFSNKFCRFYDRMLERPLNSIQDNDNTFDVTVCGTRAAL